MTNTVQYEIDRIVGNILDAYDAVQAKGGTVPLPIGQKSADLASSIATISSGGYGSGDTPVWGWEVTASDEPWVWPIGTVCGILNATPTVGDAIYKYNSSTGTWSLSGRTVDTVVSSTVFKFGNGITGGATFGKKSDYNGWKSVDESISN